MSFPQLTRGAIMDTYNNNTEGKPVLQIIDIKELSPQTQATANNAKRFRLVLSDGVHYQQAMLATQLNEMVECGKLTKDCIVQLTEYICNTVTGRRMVIVLGLLHLHQGQNGQIGNPTNVEQSLGSGPPPALPTPAPSVPAYMNRQAHGAQPEASQSFGLGGGSERSFHPISSLNPYQNRWTIKARVTSKSDMRTWHNARGDGKLFSVDLLDRTGGQIKATMFNSAADKFFQVFQPNQVYIISKGALKLANKKFTTIPNEYELTLNDDAEVEYVGEDNAIESQRFEFVRIEQIPSIPAEEVLDLIGIVKSVSPISSITSKKTQNELTKRNVVLTDRSLLSVDVTFWGADAEKYNEEIVDQVLAIKSCRVSEFGGRSLSTSFSSRIYPNLDRPEAHDLRQWYDSQGRGAVTESISKKGNGGGGGDPRKTFQQAKDERLGMDKADYYAVKGTVTFFRHEIAKPPWYNACPSAECNKKVTVNESTGMWFCEKCNKTYPAPSYRYILSLMCCDGSGSNWLTAFDEVAKGLLGRSAAELSQFKEANNEKEFERTFLEANFKSFIFKIKARAETRDDEQKVRYSVMSATPINFRTESQLLLDAIAQY